MEFGRYLQTGTLALGAGSHNIHAVADADPLADDGRSLRLVYGRCLAWARWLGVIWLVAIGQPDRDLSR